MGREYRNCDTVCSGRADIGIMVGEYSMYELKSGSTCFVLLFEFLAAFLFLSFSISISTSPIQSHQSLFPPSFLPLGVASFRFDWFVGSLLSLRIKGTSTATASSNTCLEDSR